MIISFIQTFLIFLVCSSVVQSKVLINEVQSSNHYTLSDDDGHFSDWIELYNSGEQDLELTGMFLSDDSKALNKWAFPYTIIPAKSFLLIWASGKNKTSPDGSLHTNFSISANGEVLILTDLYGERIDSVNIPALNADFSFGRIPDGSTHLRVSSYPTPYTANVLSESLSPPSFSHTGGFYNNGFLLSLSHPDPEAVIIYTLDGSDPVLGNPEGYSYQYKNRYKELPVHLDGEFTTDRIYTYLYSEPIEITNRTAQPLDAAKVPSTYQFQHQYIPTLTEQVFKGTVLKARVYKEGSGYSPVITHSYFVHPDGRARYQLPVISVSVSKEWLFDYDKGIHVAGKDFDEWRNANPLLPARAMVPANYRRTGAEWEYPVQIEYFEKEQTHAEINQNVGLRIHGGWTRMEPQKGLRVYARKDYGKSGLTYPFFDQTNQEDFKRLILKNTYNFRVEDDTYQRMVRHLNFPTQASQYAVLFLNGEYWGIHEIKERFDKHFLANKYGIDPENIDYLSNEGLISEGDNIAYQTLLNFISVHPLDIPDNYKHVAEKIDIENYIDYYVAEIYSGNNDWPHNNIDFWRLRTDSILKDVPYGHDGRWRWLMYDLDLSLNGVATEDSSAHNTLEWASRDHPSAILFRSLLQNNFFSGKFINRFADLLNTTFLFERVSPLITDRSVYIEKFFPEHLTRWKSISGGISKLRLVFDRMLNFNKYRPSFVRKHILDKFSLDGQIQLTLNTNFPQSRNYIRINTIDINEKTVGVSEQPYPWTGIYFNGVPVEITAVAATGYKFSHWEGMPENTPEKFTHNFTRDVELKAIFNKLFTPEYTLTYSSSERGYIEGHSMQIVEEAMDGSPVTAIPYEGYVFKSWTDGNTDNPRTDRNISGDISVEALFNFTTSVQSLQNIQTTIYPNPVINTLTIEFSKAQHIAYSIVNLQGHQVQNGSFYEKSQTIEVSQLPASVYILWFEGENKDKVYYKFIKT